MSAIYHLHFTFHYSDAISVIFVMGVALLILHKFGLTDQKE